MKYKNKQNNFRKTMGFNKKSQKFKEGYKDFGRGISGFDEGQSEFKNENKLEKTMKGIGYVVSSAILTGAVLYGLLGDPETQYNGPAYENLQDTSKVEYDQDSTKYHGGRK